MSKFLAVISMVFFLSSFCFAGDEFDQKLFEQSMRKISKEAARKADIATKDEWDKIQKQQQKDIDAIWESLRPLKDNRWVIK
ncbi:MAG: hypothetical protein WC332_00830 [Clostridia bacterium]|jgi:hypothetical protein